MPLTLVKIGPLGAQVVVQAAGWVCVIAGLRGIIVTCPSQEFARTAKWLLTLAWIGAASSLLESLPEWMSPPKPIKLLLSAATLALVIGIGVVIQRVGRLLESLANAQLANPWFSASLAWHIVYSLGWTITFCAGWYFLIVGPSQAPIQLSGNLIFIISIVLILAPAIMLVRAAGATARAMLAPQDRCPNCGYPRAGLPGDLCPECGSSSGFAKLPADASPVLPPRNLSRLLVTPAAVLALLAATQIWLNPRTGGNRFRPTWMIIRDARVAVRFEQAAESIRWAAAFSKSTVDPTSRYFSEDAVEAQKELLSRFSSGQISRSQAREIVSSAIAVQSDLNTQIGQWGDLFAEAYAAGVVTPEELDRFMVGSVSFRVEPRTPVSQADPIPFEVVLSWRGPRDRHTSFADSNMTQALDITINRILLDGAKAGPAPTPGVFVPHSLGQVGVYSFTEPANVPGWELPIANAQPGVHQFQIEATISIKPEYPPSIVPSFPEGPMGYAIPRSFVLSAPIAVTRPKESAGQRTNDPVGRAALSAIEAHIWGLNSTVPLLSLQIPGNATSEEFAFQVMLKVKNRILPIGVVTLGGSIFNNSAHLELAPDVQQAIREATDAEIRLILRPGEDALKHTAHAKRILDGGDIDLKPPTITRD
jgi:hypothetical protein